VLTRAQKETQVAELREKLQRATSVLVADYRGLDVKAVSELRGKLKTEGEGQFEYQVTKNTLLRLAVEGTDVASLGSSFEGPTAIAISFGEPVGLAKLLVDYAKEHEAFELKAGWLEGRAIDTDEIATLARLPSLEVLRGQLAGLVQAPARQLAQLAQAPAAQLARVMEARRRKLEEDGGS
jgi:large subunit ribosomal protein L10